MTRQKKARKTATKKKTTNWVDKKAKSNDWHTPAHVLDLVREYFGGTIPLDPCTTAKNPTGAAMFFTAKEDGLKRVWKGPAFVNPPYSCVDLMTKKKRYPIREWIAKVHQEAGKGLPIIALLPCGARFSTGYWQDHALVEELTAACFVRGRLKFINATTRKPGKGNNYDSMIYGFNVDPLRFGAIFGSLGTCFGTTHLSQFAVKTRSVA